jgi:hypothetical protein
VRLVSRLLKLALVWVAGIDYQWEGIIPKSFPPVQWPTVHMYLFVLSGFDLAYEWVGSAGAVITFTRTAEE